MSTDKADFEPAIIPKQRPGKEGGARERNRRARTNAICEAALDLFLERGLGPTTVEEITKAAGVAKGSFYRYFPDKAGVVDALFSPLEEAMITAFERCRVGLEAATTSSALTDAYGTLASELSVVLLGSEKQVRLYLQECRGSGDGSREPIRRLADKITDGAIALTQTARQRGLLRDLPAQVTAVAVIGAVEGMLARQFSGHPMGNPLEVSAALISMVLEGIRAP
jgi:AcrR family transcriptional regulator